MLPEATENNSRYGPKLLWFQYRDQGSDTIRDPWVLLLQTYPNEPHGINLSSNFQGLNGPVKALQVFLYVLSIWWSSALWLGEAHEAIQSLKWPVPYLPSPTCQTLCPKLRPFSNCNPSCFQVSPRSWQFLRHLALVIFNWLGSISLSLALLCSSPLLNILEVSTTPKAIRLVSWSAPTLYRWQRACMSSRGLVAFAHSRSQEGQFSYLTLSLLLDYPHLVTPLTRCSVVPHQVDLLSRTLQFPLMVSFRPSELQEALVDILCSSPVSRLWPWLHSTTSLYATRYPLLHWDKLPAISILDLADARNCQFSSTWHRPKSTWPGPELFAFPLLCLSSSFLLSNVLFLYTLPLKIFNTYAEQQSYHLVLCWQQVSQSVAPSVSGSVCQRLERFFPDRVVSVSSLSFYSNPFATIRSLCLSFL